MKTHASPSLTLAHAFEQFLEISSFARRTRESYAEDLTPLLTQVGQKPITAITDTDLQAFLTRQESLAPAIDIDDISWSERSVRIHGKGDRPREMFFSRAVSTFLDRYLATRGSPTSGPLFVTHRKARLPRRADLTSDGYARLSYRQADTLWKGYTPNWDLHQLRHTAVSVRAAHDYTEADLKRFSGHTSLRSLERYIADNREAAKRKAREWERRQRSQ